MSKVFLHCVSNNKKIHVATERNIRLATNSYKLIKLLYGLERSSWWWYNRFLFDSRFDRSNKGVVCVYFKKLNNDDQTYYL